MDNKKTVKQCRSCPWRIDVVPERAKWLQRAGTRHEHFDVFGALRERAVAAGAREVTIREAVAVWWRKGEDMKAKDERKGNEHG